ncbi:MAG: PD40 domain-containing protein [Myxococcales bacterium]|nr:PD40 domain-containing protein [Myxococcales bacterium]
MFVLSPLLLAACGRLNFDPTSTLGDLDGAVDTTDGPTACKGAFQAARNLTEINTALDEDGGAISADGLELYFGSNRAGGAGDFDLYVAKRSAFGMPFGPPVNVAAVNSSVYDDNPYVEPDGLTLWWQQGARIVRSVRPDRSATWLPPLVVAELDSGTDDQAPTFTPDGLTLYYSSTRNLGAAEIFRATRPSRTAPFGAPVLEATASSNTFDCCPEVLAGGDRVAFSSQRGTAWTQVWVAPRNATDGSLGVATLFSLVDSPGTDSDYDPFATPDDTTVGVASTRANGQGGGDIWLYERACP